MAHKKNFIVGERYAILLVQWIAERLDRQDMKNELLKAFL
jgi:hypothetical protein